MKKIIRNIIPEPLLLGYHLALAKIAAAYYGNPSKKLYVIGITGTKGKTSAANFIWSVLESNGYKTGQIGTARWRLGDREVLNSMHMTMPGRFMLQKLLREMLDAGCTHAVMEVTSEGIKLNRHAGIVFDCAVFTNLSPEHLESHGGSFEKYKQTKGRLFASLMEHAKLLKGKYVKRLSIVNFDDPNKDYFSQFPADKKITFGVGNGADVRAENITEGNAGVQFICQNTPFRLSILGGFNVYNALPAIAISQALGLDLEKTKRGVAELKMIDGRMEKIDEGQKFTVLVDYAHENVSLNTVLDAGRKISGNGKLILLTGSQGGGRDSAKRPLMGQTAAKKADFVVVTNEDPYDDDPKKIMEEVASACEAHGKIRGQNLFVIEQRREGIAKALSLAQPGDVVIIAGKGAEQTMMVGGGSIPWDERGIVREELGKILVK